MKSQISTRSARATTPMATYLIRLEGFSLSSIQERDNFP
jgi:hypothetical protein